MKLPQLKKIDSLLIVSFIPPFILAFMIAIFVLMMQTLWVYVDDIVGKGVGFFLLVELLGYLTVSLIPMALPIAVLIASVMVFGSLAEQYELSSMKSAGASLLRIMRPLIVFGLFISMFSYFSYNYLIPVSNLKFKSRLYDIRKQKPTLSLEEGVFNYDFQGYAIRIGEKHPDGHTIEDIMIYDHTSSRYGELNLVTSERGNMYITRDQNFFVMTLYDGHQYQELVSAEKRNAAPMMRSEFEEWKKVFDLRQFQLDRTDEDLFKTHRTMLNVGQLADAIDSIRSRETKYQGRLMSSLPVRAPPDSQAENGNKEKESDAVEREENNSDPSKQSNLENRRERYLDRAPYDSSHALLVTTFDEEVRNQLLSRLKRRLQSAGNTVRNAHNTLDRLKKSRYKHLYELHIKFSRALACIIFLFIGAPMGAIIRKGGFGYPMLVSILFFMLYIIMNILFKELSEAVKMDPILAAWMPNIILFPIGLLLTIQAMNDTKFLDIGLLWARYFKNKEEDDIEQT